MFYAFVYLCRSIGGDCLYNGIGRCATGLGMIFVTFSIALGCRLRPFDPRHDKTNWMSVRPAKSPISLGFRPVWSESSLCAQWVAEDPMFLHADNEDFDQTGRMPGLIWVVVGRTLILLVLSCRGSFGIGLGSKTATFGIYLGKKILVCHQIKRNSSSSLDFTQIICSVL